MSISEYNMPWPGKTAVPKHYGNTYRLELNRELYEGVRFAWIHVRNVVHPWHITSVRLISQIKPTNYEGAFASSDPMLTRIWYAGAYAEKLNLLKDSFAAILIDRGDRLTWTGDAHPAQAASMVAFGNWDFVKHNLQRTSHTGKYDNDIESYPLVLGSQLGGLLPFFRRPSRIRQPGPHSGRKDSSWRERVGESAHHLLWLGRAAGRWL